MKESDLRKWHRQMGIILALFIILQAGSGLLITLSEIGPPHSHTHSESAGIREHNENEASHWKNSLMFIHHGAGTIGVIYRIILGIGMLGMAFTGSMIFLKIRARTK